MNPLVEQYAVHLARRNHVPRLCVHGVSQKLADTWELENNIRFPPIYKEYLMAVGSCIETMCCPNIDGSVSNWSDFAKLRGMANEVLQWGGSQKVLSENCFVLTIYQEEAFHFLRIDEGEDPPVYYYGGGDEPWIIKHASFSTYLKKLCAERF